MLQSQKIKLLPKDVVSKIAAGEVIERPSSVIKELLENAIDSGASKVDVRIGGGGTSLIEISDNGCGIAKDDLELALVRHATSKMVDNIDDIRFLGFRGEALASIRSVAEVSIESRTGSSDEAWKISAKGEEEVKISPAVRNIGTSVTIKNLFYLVPNKLRFMKSELSENASSMNIIQRIALANPDVSFTIELDNKRPVKYEAAVGDIEKRIKDIMGEEFWQDSLYLEHGLNDMRITGYVSSPTSILKRSRTFFCVNKRIINDPSITSIFRIAYKDIAANNSKQSGVLFIDVNRGDIDVNIHPNKTQIKFLDEVSLKKLIISGIRKSLSRATVSSSIGIDFMSRKSVDIENARASEVSKRYADDIQTQFDLRENTSSNFISDFRQDYSEKAYQAKYPNKDLEVINEKSRPEEAKPSITYYKDEERKAESTINTLSLGRAIYQLDNKYIVSVEGGNLNIIDQHAAHERLVLEKMKADMKKGGIRSQALVMPEIIRLGSDEVIILIELKKELAELGITVDFNGENELIVRSVPAILGGLDDIAGLLSDIARQSNLYEEIAESSIMQRCNSIACHASIRAGRKLNIDEMNAILREMEGTDFSSQCNHGRPTYIKFSLSEIDKLFRRT